MKKIEQVVILNGGYGKRVKSISKNKPKCLLIIKKKSFLHHQLLYFKSKVSNVLICAGYKSNYIKKELSDISINNLKIKVNIENSLLGTGGAIKNSFKDLNKYFFVTYGDSWLNINFDRLKKFFLKCQNNNLITVIDKKIVKNHDGNIDIKKNKIIDYEKNNKNYQYIDYGLMIFDRNIFKNLKLKSFDLSLVIKKLIKKQKISFFIVKKKFYHIGTVKSYNELKKKL